MTPGTSYRSLHQTLVLADIDPMECFRLLLRAGCPMTAALECICAALPKDGGPVFAHSKPEEGTHPWNLVRFLIQGIQVGALELAQAVSLLQGYRIHPWSLVWMAKKMTGLEALAWGESLSLPAAFLAYAKDWGDCSDFSAGFAFHGDPAMEWIPEGFKVDSLLLRHCARLAAIGPGFESEGILELINCGLLATLPEAIRVLHFIRIWDCASFSRLPSAFSTGGLQLQELPLLDRLDLPRAFTGFLEVEDCLSLHSIQVWSQHLKLLRVIHCDVTSLPPGLKVDESLNLEGLPIGAIPPGLQVGGDCRLSNLRACTSFGDRISIGGDLFLTNLPRLQSLPEGLSVGGKVVVDARFDQLVLPEFLRDRLSIEE